MAGLFSKKGKAASPNLRTEAGTDAEAESQGPQFPLAHDTPAIPGRSIAWASRLVGLFALVSMMLNITLGMALVTLLPLKQVQPFLVQIAEDKNVFTTIRPIPEAIGGLPLLTEKLVGEYVQYRHEIVRSQIIMEQRWTANGQVALMSSGAEFGRFQRQAAATFEALRQSDVTQEVVIDVVNPIRFWSEGPPAQLGVYQVQFRTIGRDAGNRVISTRYWNATIEFSFQTLEGVANDRRLLNPTGFVASTYTLAERPASAVNTPPRR